MASGGDALQTASRVRNSLWMRAHRGYASVLLLLFAGCSGPVDEGEPGPGRADARPPVVPMIPDAQPLPALRVDYADPDHGPFVGGTEVTLRGRGFLAGMTVTVGGKRVDPVDLEVVDTNRAVIKTPAGTPGDADIEVIAGENQTLREDVFLYEPIYLEPAAGAISGGTYVRIRGLGTNFLASDIVSFDGKAMTGVQIINAQELVGFTPSGVAGGADVRILAAAGGELFAQNGFTYENAVDPLFAGMGGGPIHGSVNITLVDGFTENGIPMAVAVLGDPETSPYYGITDPFGQVTISAPGLVGPVTLTAGHKKYESGTLAGFDASTVAMFLQPLPDLTLPPPQGPFPPGRAPGNVSGDVVFGGTTGIGTTDWDLVPEPRTDTERKRTYVFPTARDIFSGDVNPGPGGIIDFEPGESAWHYDIPVRPTAFALVALAGLYDPEIDPDGAGPQPKGLFTPYAMGVLRNVLVGPGDRLENLSIVINIPLDSGIKVVLDDAPALRDFATGPDEYRVNAFIDLGGEGVIRLPGSRSVFRSAPSTILTGLAPISLGISDGSYTIAAGTYSTRGSPTSLVIKRGVRDLSQPVVVEGFVGIQRAIDPPDGESSTNRRLAVDLEGGTGVPTFRHYRLIDLANGFPVWRVIARGDQPSIPLYSLQRFGLDPMATGRELYWSAYSVHIPGGNFDTFNYGQLNANYWRAYSIATFTATFE